MKQSRLYRILFFFLFFTGLTSCAPVEESAIDTSRITVPVDQPAGHTPFQAAIARFEAELAGDVSEDGAGSISAAVVRGNDVVRACGFGWADIGRSIPADEQTVYRTGSISKSFTAVLMMELAEQGFFDIDDEFSGYFPAFDQVADKPAGSPAVTFRHLASHTSGLIREPQLRDAASGPIENWGGKILESIPNTRYQTAPGTEYSYSNIGFGILGYALEQIAGESFMDLVEKKIFDPLGMNSSFFIIPAHLYEHVSMGYTRRRDGTVDGTQAAGEHAGRGYKVPNGGIYSTVLDLAKFVSAMTGSAPVEIFSEETRREMLTRQTPEGGGGYGLGFSISADEDGFTTMGHGGSVAGYNAHIVFDPASKLGVILLRNYSGGSTNLGRSARSLLKELAAADGR